MKRGKGFLSSLKLIQSLNLTPPTRLIHFQVTRHSGLSLFPYFFLSKQTDCKCNNGFLHNYHQKVYFSSIPISIVELISTNEWSQGLEHELEKSHIPASLTHETVLYVLKNLEKTPLKALEFFNWAFDKHGFIPSSMVYTPLLRILGDKEFFKEFWILVKKLWEKGNFEIDKKTYLIVLGNFKNAQMQRVATHWTQLYKMTEESVKVAVDVVLGSLDFNDDMEKKLGELKVNLTENTILRIFRELYPNPLKALSFFIWLRDHMGYTHNAVTYNGIVTVLGQEKSIKEFWTMVNELKAAGHELDIGTYLKVSVQLEKSRIVEDLVKLYELMMDGPYKVPIPKCIYLLRSVSRIEPVDSSFVSRVVKKYEAAGYAFCKDVYDGIYWSLISADKFDEAEKILVTMRNEGFEPDILTYNQRVFGLGKFGRLEEAIEMLDEMKSKGCAPNVNTWTFLIRGLCSVGEVDQALKCFTKTLEKFTVNADLLEVMADGLCSKGQVNGAFTLVCEWVDKANLRPSLATYKTLIQNLLVERKLQEAMNLLHLMKKHNFPPWGEPFADYLSKFGTVDDARELFKALKVKQQPSSSVYLHVLQSFFNEGRKSEAQDLLDKCPRYVRKRANILTKKSAARS